MKQVHTSFRGLSLTGTALFTMQQKPVEFEVEQALTISSNLGTDTDFPVERFEKDVDQLEEEGTLTPALEEWIRANWAADMLEALGGAA